LAATYYFARIRYDGTTYYGAWSTTGTSWTNETAITLGFTPAYFGIACYNDSTTASATFDFDYVRGTAYEEGATGLNVPAAVGTVIDAILTLGSGTGIAVNYADTYTLFTNNAGILNIAAEVLLP